MSGKHNPPIVSVIIPVHNVAHCLDECISSVMNQSLSNWECIVVDDGSTDDSLDICRHWSDRDERIRVVSQENQGVSVARNTGLSLADGEYVVFIDSDDRVDSDYLHELLNGRCLYKSAELIVTGLIRQYRNGHQACECPKQEQCIQLNFDYANLFIENIAFFYGPTSKLYRLDIIRKWNISFPTDFSLGEDLLFNFTYLKCISNVALLPKAHYYYNIQDGGSLMTTYRDDRFFVDFHLWKVQYSFLQEKGMWNDSAKKYLSLQLWGIICNGVFNKKEVSLIYLKEILGMVDANILNISINSFPSSAWIKKAIIKKRANLFYMVRKVRKILIR